MPRSLHFALFAIGLLWLLAARVGAQNAATGIARLFHAEQMLGPVLNALFLVILLVTGFTALNWVATRNGSLRSTNALPSRPTARREWQVGAALGWALSLLAILPAMLIGALHPMFWVSPRAFGLSFLALLTVLFGSLAMELAFRGFLFRSLMGATGPTMAAFLLAVIYAFTVTSATTTTPFSFSVSLLMGILFAMAYLRTRALWLGWGLHFASLAVVGVLFGLPLAGSAELAGLVASEASGPVWVTGGFYGPQGAFLTLVVLLAGMFALYRLTRDFAWDYTHPPIVAGGYPMDIPPPPAHTAMEAAAPPPPLVQILGATPVTPSTAPFINEHLAGGRATKPLEDSREDLPSS